MTKRQQAQIDAIEVRIRDMARGVGSIDTTEDDEERIVCSPADLQKWFMAMSAGAFDWDAAAKRVVDVENAMALRDRVFARWNLDEFDTFAKAAAHLYACGVRA